MEKQTTQDTLEALRNNIEHFNSAEWYEGVTMECLEQNYRAYKEVAETLSIKELRLIALLRRCRHGEITRFLKVAQALYNSLKVFDELGKI